MSDTDKKPWQEKFLAYSYRYLAWSFIVLSLLLVLLSMSEVIPNEKVNLIIEKIGIALFSSGVFAAVLKSLQFTGIFKEEIEKVILSSDFIKNRRDLLNCGVPYPKLSIMRSSQKLVKKSKHEY